MSNEYINWKEYYSVGDYSLDAQHRQILKALNELFKATSNKSNQKIIKPLLDQLTNYALTHFETEERIMQEHGYPDFAEHKAKHDKFRQEVDNLRNRADSLSSYDMLLFLKEWWINHIQGSDKKYAPFLAVPVEH